MRLGFSRCLRTPVTSPNQMNLRVPHPWFVRVGSYTLNAQSFFSSLLFSSLLCESLRSPRLCVIFYSLLHYLFTSLLNPPRIHLINPFLRSLRFRGPGERIVLEPDLAHTGDGLGRGIYTRVSCCSVLQTGSSLYLETSGERHISALFFPTTTFPSSQDIVTPNRVLVPDW